MGAPGLVAEARRRLEAAGLDGDVAEVSSARFDGVETAVVAIPMLAPAATLRLVTQALDGLAYQCFMVDAPVPRAVHNLTVAKNNRTWRVGTQAEVSWINDSVTVGAAITSAITPVFDAYATVVIPDSDTARRCADSVLLQLLAEQGADQPWWLGYLDTGAHDVVFDQAPKVAVYTGWTYVLMQAGPTEAGSWREDDAWRGRLPDLIFPADRSWLVSMLWDDDWRCLGGPAALIRAVLAEPALDARPVGLDEDATPPGHVTY